VLVAGDATSKALLLPTAEHAVRNAAFRKECADKTLTLTFQFVMDNRPRNDCPAAIVSFGYPNRFTILVPAPVLNVD
jgi:hypothetical protein